MSDLTKICYTCRSTTSTKYYVVKSPDMDNITYWDKLKDCISVNLIETDPMEMCWVCVKHLRNSYKFKMTVLLVQEALRKSIETDDPVNTNTACANDKLFLQSESIKIESECVPKDEYMSDDDETSAFITALKAKHEKRIKDESDACMSCDLCGAEFSKNWQLKKHLARVHNEVRKFVCTHCNKEFKQKFHLKEHITSHTGEMNYSCPICDKKFMRLSSQKRHVKGHSAPPGYKTKRTPFLCTICGKSFPFSNGVQRHMRIHLGIKKFECKLCNRKFTQSTHLQVHMRTHTGEKPYICETCGEKFSLKSCMLKHINNRHYSGNTIVVEQIPVFYMPKDEFENS